VSDRLIRFPGATWQEIEALPQPVRWTVQRANFHLLDEPVPTLADPFPEDDPLPGAYELRLHSENVTIWYTVTAHEGQEVISIQHVRLSEMPTARSAQRCPSRGPAQHRAKTAHDVVEALSCGRRRQIAVGTDDRNLWPALEPSAQRAVDVLHDGAAR
jgi:hypothetical protein